MKNIRKATKKMQKSTKANEFGIVTFQEKRVMEKNAEEEVVKVIIDQVKKNNMTITNVKAVAAKVINYLESNAILEKEDSDSAKSPIL